VSSTPATRACDTRRAFAIPTLRRSVVAVLVLLGGLVGCAETAAVRCEDGRFCPVGTVCLADGRCAQPPQVLACEGRAEGEACLLPGVGEGVCRDLLCVVAVCGNDALDPGEVCDDGNRVGGDGCAADCGSTEACGNGIVELEEQCDCGSGAAPGGGLCEGTQNGGPVCSVDCLRPLCGNAIVDEVANEACDDGNLVEGDGCSATCFSTEECGNGILDLVVGEECDDGDLDDGDGCQSTCRAPRCGDGVVSLGEVCDDGVEPGPRPKTFVDVPLADGDGCRSDCLSEEVCGNGIVDPAGADGEPGSADDEECDDANAADDDGCAATCRVPRCGDRLVDAARGEVCDDGNAVGGDGCAADCRSDEECGNGVVDVLTGEACDAGGANALDPDATCRPDCQFARCGDGIVDPARGEACDDGLGNGDAPDVPCRASCVPWRCGDAIVDPAAGEVCDDGGRVGGDGCAADCASDETCGNGLVDYLEGEACDEGAANSDLPDAACRTDCQPGRCGDEILDEGAGERCDDGNDAAGDGCSPDCASTEQCGNGLLDLAGADAVPGTSDDEYCDDGNPDTTDGCIACAFAGCGDGYVWAATEQCDAGAANSSTPDAACRTTCELPRCGDGTIDPGLGELCDDGTATADLPNARCRLGELDPARRCRFRACGDGIVDTLFGEACDDGNASATDACLPTCAAARCGDGFVRAGVEVCDDGNQLGGDGCAATCASREVCGDGIVDLGEECDDGNVLDDDACRTTCRLNGCGDDVVDPVGRDRVAGTADDEACDDGNRDDGDGCAADCRSDESCGNGVVDPVTGEACDDGNAIDDDACRNSCRVNGCGDGVVVAAGLDGVVGTADDEACDDGDADDRDACTTACRAAACGDGIVRTGVEWCDDGDADDGDECTRACAPGPICEVASAHALAANPARLVATAGAAVVPAAPGLCLGTIFTIEAWFRRVSGPGDPVLLGTLTSSPGGLAGFALGMIQNDTQSRLIFRAGTPTGPVTLASARGAGDPTALADGAWHHVAVTSDGATLSLFVDGELDAARPWDGVVTCGGGDLLLGAMPQLVFEPGGIPTYVDVDEVRLSSDVVYPEEFTPCLQYGPEADAVAYWRLDEATAAPPLADAVGAFPATSTIGTVQAIGGASR
jgi:cysteine-rich repeat protein